jgi:hypothetical protein
MKLFPIGFISLIIMSTSCTKTNERSNVTNTYNNARSELQSSLTNQDFQVLSNKFGEINYESYKTNNPTPNSLIKTISFKEKGSVITKLIITKNTVNKITETNSCIFEIIDKDNTSNNFKDLKQIKNGIIRIYFLNTGEILEKTISNGLESTNQRTDGINISYNDSTSSNGTPPNNAQTNSIFGSCFKSCVANEMSKLSWVEAAACLLASEVCAATFLAGCTGFCLYTN